MDINQSSAARRSKQKHRAVLDAAVTCVDRLGYTAATIEAIAAEAGVGKQTIYRWWPCKAALFVEVYTDLVREDMLADQGGAGHAALAGLLRALFHRFRETPAGAILAGLVSEATSDASARGALEQGLVLGRASIVADIINSAVRRGDMDASASVVNEVVVAMVWKQLVLNPSVLDDAYAETLADIAIAAGRRGVPQ